MNDGFLMNGQILKNLSFISKNFDNLLQLTVRQN